jgi:hypothetical protein
MTGTNKRGLSAGVHRLPLMALIITVTGLRWAVFAYAGSPLPYFDQWLAEFNNLFLLGTVSHSGAGIWLTPHNEHFPVTMKLASLLGFLLNGYWDVKFLALVSGLVRAAGAGATWVLLSRQTGRGQRITLWLLCALAFGWPWSAFNALNGMQVSFYFADLALLLSLLVVQRWAGARSGLALIGLMLLGLGSMASALAIPPATLGLHLTRRQARPGFAVAWLCTLVLALAYIIIPAGTGAEPVQSIATTAHFFLTLLAWPLPWAGWGACVLIGGIAFFIHYHNGTAPPALAVAFALGVFAAGNCAMLALHRSPADFHPRHWDSVGWLPFGIAVLLGFWTTSQSVRRVVRLGGGVVVAGLGAALLATFFKVSWPYLHAAHHDRAAVVQHYRHAFLSGEFRAESARVNRLLIDRDYAFFDDPAGRFALPPSVAANIAATPLPDLALLGPDILPSRGPSLTARLTALLFWISPGIAATGLLAFVWSCRRLPAQPGGRID